MPNDTRYLQIGTLLVRPWGHRHDATQCSSAERTSMGTLYIRHQLTDVTVQSNVLVALQLLEGDHEARDQCLEHCCNYLALCAAT